MTTPVAIILPADAERLRVGGIESFVRGFVKFAPPDFEISLAGIATGPDPHPVGRWRTVHLEGRDVQFLPVMRRATTRRGRIPLALLFTLALGRHRRLLEREGLVLQFHRPGTALPLLGLPQPKVRVVHLTTDQLRTAGSESRWRLTGPLLDRLESRTLHRMDNIYVVNSDATTDYRRRFPRVAERIAFLPNWVDDTLFHRAAEDRRAIIDEAWRARLGLEPGARIVLYAGRLEGQKDPFLLIDAFAALKSSQAAAVLLVVGDGGLRDPARARAASRGVGASVRFLDPIDRPQLADLMNVADVLAVTSVFEAGPTIAYEALASGLPVVGTAVGQIPHLVTNGANGQVVEGRDATAMAAAMAWALDQPRGSLRDASIKASRPFRARAVLDGLYAAHRRLRR